MTKKLTQQEFIAKANKIHGNKYDYSKTNYINSRSKVCITCPQHGEFWVLANHHLRGQGCVKCSFEALSKKFASNTEQFIKKAKAIHGDKYDYSKVEYKNAYTKVCIICPQHGEFWQTPSAHINVKEGCPKCGHQIPLTIEEFKAKANKIHGNKYDYSKVEYKNATTKVCIICPKHGEFWQRLNSHVLQKNGCSKCAAEARHKKYTRTTTQFIEKAQKVHGDKYDYSKVDYINNYTKICITCPKHGDFWQTPNAHLNLLEGCPKCMKSKMENYIELFLKKHNIVFEAEKTYDWLKYKNNMLLDFYLPQQKIAIECQGGQHFIPVKYMGGDEMLSIIKERDAQKYNLCQENGINMLYIIPYRYRNSNLIQTYYKDKKYIFFKNIDNQLLKLLLDD